ncbi:hypothetical protein pclt_cds_375 [Pandoravirus celtis]|uniref:Uncharacterized protein n=1 Tax=Pandoravirus celtis TaxID=2568002 RepID=A0A4D6EGZ0_9VIRU|nr:hypothetical protein pclt_cds_375 [Pandoravirus celtis]
MTSSRKSRGNDRHAPSADRILQPIAGCLCRAFRPPTPESLLRVWQAVDATRTPDGLARLICGITGRVRRALWTCRVT